MGQELAYIAVAAFADAEQTVPPTGAVLSWRQSQGGRKIAPSMEGLAIAQCTGQGTGRERTDTPQGQQPLSHRIIRDVPGDLFIEGDNALIQIEQILRQPGEQHTKSTGQPVFVILQPARQSAAQLLDAEWGNEAIPANQSADLVGLAVRCATSTSRTR